MQIDRLRRGRASGDDVERLDDVLLHPWRSETPRLECAESNRDGLHQLPAIGHPLAALRNRQHRVVRCARRTTIEPCDDVVVQRREVGEQ